MKKSGGSGHPPRLALHVGREVAARRGREGHVLLGRVRSFAATNRSQAINARPRGPSSGLHWYRWFPMCTKRGTAEHIWGDE